MSRIHFVYFLAYFAVEIKSGFAFRIIPYHHYPVIHHIFFSFPATIEKEMRKQFNIPDGKEVRLWSRYMSNTYEQLSKLDSTIQDAGLYQGQVSGLNTETDLLLKIIFYITHPVGFQHIAVILERLNWMQAHVRKRY